MPTPVIFNQIHAILRGVAATGSRFADELAALPRDFLDAIPNPFAMAKVVLDFGSSLAAIAISIPFSGLEQIAGDYLRAAKLGNKLIRGDRALRWMFEGFTAFSQTITLTRDFGLLVWLAQTAAVWLYRTFRHWQFIWRIAHVGNETELARLFIDKFARRLGTLRIVGLIVGGFIVLAAAGAQILMIGIAITIVDGTAGELFLAQDSRKVRVNPDTTYQKRLNKRKGPDR